MFTFICVWINDWVNNRETLSRSLWRHRNAWMINDILVYWWCGYDGLRGVSITPAKETSVPHTRDFISRPCIYRLSVYIIWYHPISPGTGKPILGSKRNCQATEQEVIKQTQFWIRIAEWYISKWSKKVTNKKCDENPSVKPPQTMAIQMDGLLAMG